MSDNKEIDDIVAILDGFAKSETGRLKVKMSEEMEAGEAKREYHIGRCDINSPWACGAYFDVLEDDKE